jgi:hypothetical protein
MMEQGQALPIALSTASGRWTHAERQVDYATDLAAARAVCERRVEHYAREGASWRLTEARDAETLAVPCLDVVLPLDEVYDGMEGYLEGAPSA